MQYVEGEIVVGFASQTPVAIVNRIIGDFGLKITKILGPGKIYLLEVPVGTEQGWLVKFRIFEEVNFAELNGNIFVPTNPNDPQ